jgi:aspartate racemase
MNKRIGILGGMGPLATVFLYKKIIDHVQASNDQAYPRIIIDNHSKIPDRTEFILSNGEDPTDYLVDSAKLLKDDQCDFAIMPCNTAHYFLDNIQAQVELEFINLLTLTAQRLKEEHISQIYLFATEGTNQAEIYKESLNQQGIQVLRVDPKDQAIISKHIYNIKGYNFSLEEAFEAIVEKYEPENVLLACSELSLAKDRFEFHMDKKVYDTMDFLAFEAIKKAGYQLKR